LIQKGKAHRATQSNNKPRNAAKTRIIIGDISHCTARLPQLYESSSCGHMSTRCFNISICLQSPHSPSSRQRHRENANQNSSAPRTSARDCHQRNGAQSNRSERKKSNHSNNIIIIFLLDIAIASKYHILLRFTQSRRHQSTPPPPPLAQSPPRSFQPPAPCHRPFSSASSVSP